MSEAERAAELIDFLLLRTSLDEVARYLVIHLLEDLKPWEADILSCDVQGRLQVVGSFGAGPSSVDELKQLADGTSLPALAVLKGRPQTNMLSPEGSMLECLPMLGMLGEGARVLWPLTAPVGVVGMVQVKFLDVPDHERMVRALSGVSPVLALVLLLLQRTLHGERRHSAWMRMSAAALEEKARDYARRQEATGLREEATPAAQLTNRQRAVLSLLALGLTNEQIARRISFSASTVRQETMVIYRVLGATGRSEAVAIARRRGIELDVPEDTGANAEPRGDSDSHAEAS